MSINVLYVCMNLHIYCLCALTMTLLLEADCHSAVRHFHCTVAPHCEHFHPKCKHYTYTIPGIFQCGNPQSTGPTGGKQASSLCVFVLYTGSEPVPSSVPNTELSRLLSGNRQAKSAQSDLFCCCVPLGVCFFSPPKLTRARSQQLALSFLSSPLSMGVRKKKSKIAQQWMCGLGATPSVVVRALPLASLFALHPSSEAPNYENPDSFTWLCLI